jgi:hypothetical protein
MMRLQEKKGYAPGTEYELAAYIPVMVTNRPVGVKVRVEGPEEIEVGGSRRSVIRMTQEFMMPGMPAGMVATAWVDERSHLPLKTSVPMMGMTMEMVAATREVATADFEAPEAFMNTLVRANRSIDVDGSRRIKMRLSLDGAGPAMPALPETGMQTLSRSTEQSVVLEVARQDHAALSKATPATKIDRRAMAEYLQPNIYIDSDDPVVSRMADQASADAKGPYQVADRLREHVSERIEDKNLNIGFGSASEVARNLSGDCSEHAVLLAALGRAKGIPSRVVCGLVYVPWFEGADNVFGFHMWTQFFIAGQWVDFDAAQRESDCNPTHIALSVDSLHDAALGDMAFSIFPLMSRLKIEVLDIEPMPSRSADSANPPARPTANEVRSQGSGD